MNTRDHTQQIPTDRPTSLDDQRPRRLAEAPVLTENEVEYREAVDTFVADQLALKPRRARLARIQGNFRDGLASPFDLAFVADALRDIEKGVDPKRGLGISGRQHEGRPKRTAREADRRPEDARRVVHVAYAKSRDTKSPIDFEAGINTVAKQLVIERGYNRRAQDDSASTSWHGHLEDCYRELGEREIELLLDELAEDDFIKSQSEIAPSSKGAK